MCVGVVSRKNSFLPGLKQAKPARANTKVFENAPMMSVTKPGVVKIIVCVTRDIKAQDLASSFHRETLQYS